ncbi:MAG: hypothetical protein AAF483_14100 [Planctomycetota bacterium]
MTLDPVYRDLLDKANAVWGQPEQIAVLEELVRVADSNKDVNVAYGARRRLIKCCNSQGVPAKSIVAFSWCLAQFDKNPELDDEWSLIWEYKVILEIIPVFAGVSREQIIGMQEDMADRLNRIGESERTAHYYRSWNFMRMGDYELAHEYQETYTKMPRTTVSDCTACERDRQVELLSRMKLDKQALQCANDIMIGNMTCGEVPEFTNAHIVKSQMRLGMIEEAVERQKVGYGGVRNAQKYLGTVGDLLLVPIRVGDLDAAMTQVLRHLPWAVDTAADELRFRFYAATALFFEALARESPGPKKMRIPNELGCWNEEERYSSSDLAGWFSQETQSLADQFNNRNGNQAYSNLIRDNRQLVGLEN